MYVASLIFKVGAETSSLKKASKLHVFDPKPSDLVMIRLKIY